MSLTLLRKLLASRVTWGVGLCLGIALAIGTHGRLKYREGYADGTRDEKAVWVGRTAVAMALADSLQADAETRLVAAQDSNRLLEQAAARQAERAALARGQYQSALAAYQRERAADTTPPTPLTQSCDVLAQSCERAAIEAERLRDSLTAVIAGKDREIGSKDAIILGEPVRTRAAMLQASAAATPRRGASRVQWFLNGALVGALTTWAGTR